MATTVAPILMFEGTLDEALGLYTAAFADAEVADLERYDEAGPRPAGTTRAATIRLGSREIHAADSPLEHALGATPTASLRVELDSLEELDAAFATLASGGEVLMPLGSYPFSPYFGWLTDRFGVSWQLTIADG